MRRMKPRLEINDAQFKALLLQYMQAGGKELAKAFNSKSYFIVKKAIRLTRAADKGKIRRWATWNAKNADRLRAVLRALSYRRVRWFKKEDGSVRRAYVYSFEETGGMSANVRIEDTEPLAAYVVIVPLDDAVPGQREPEKEPSCLDLYPELADPMKPE